MKKNRFYYLAMVLCILAFGFTSCEKEDDDDFDSSAIYGYWQAVSAEYQEYANGKLVDEDFFSEPEDEIWGIRFTKDGDWYNWEESYYTGQIEMEYGGDFTCKNGKLKVYNSEEGGYLTFTIETLTSTQMVLTITETYTEDGVKYKYVEKETFRKVNIEQ